VSGGVSSSRSGSSNAAKPQVSATPKQSQRRTKAVQHRQLGDSAGHHAARQDARLPRLTFIGRASRVTTERNWISGPYFHRDQEIEIILAGDA
jgi:hypothetical protein